nr:hypothetical protein [Tanacetum cinerariifolium]
MSQYLAVTCAMAFNSYLAVAFAMSETHLMIPSPPPVDLSSLTANHIDLLLSSFFVFLDPFPFPIKPDLFIVSEVTHFARVFSSVSVLMDVVFGRQVHCVGVKVGKFRDVFVGISLLNVYCKCGEMRDARKVFDEMPERNSFTWATLISGYAMGLFKEVVTSVLSAFVLRFQHQIYIMTALVDMYAKCGNLDDARKEFDHLQEPDIVSWTSMIGGSLCRREINGIGITRIVCICLISIVYKALGRPQDVERVRHMMNLRGMIKEPGCSWIELKSHFRVFVVGDQLHPQIKEIRMEVHRLSKLMKDEGYYPESDSNFADLEV